MDESVAPKGKTLLAHKVFSKIGITLFAVVIVGLFVSTAFLARSVIQSGQLAAVISSVLVDLTNKDRKEEELGTLTMNPVLVAAAQAKANDMAEKGYFAHVSPEGIDPWHWIREAGYSFTYAGENLAVNFSDSEDVVSAWMGSPGHRANILNGTFTEIGIATAVGEYKGEKTTFVVQMFGTPRTTVAVNPVREVEVPQSPEDIAIATTEDDTEVLGTEVTETPVAPPSEPSVVVAQAEPAPRYATDAEILLTSPHNLLRVLYFVCAGIILLALMFVTQLEWRKHHLPHVFATCALFVLMGGLFGIADWLIFSHPVVGQELASLGGQ